LTRRCCALDAERGTKLNAGPQAELRERIAALSVAELTVPSVRLNMRLRDWTFRSLRSIRILELNGDLSVNFGKLHFLHHEAQIWFGFGYREIPALLTLQGSRSEKRDGLGAVAGPNGILHIEICPRLVQLVIKCCNNVFPWLIETTIPLLDPFGRLSENTPME
jgi:hypothetical protein